MTITSIGKSLGLAAFKKQRIAKRKILKKAMNKQMAPKGHPMYGDFKAIDLYGGDTKAFIRTNYKDIFKTKKVKTWG
jgi:hypothetical protein